MRLSSAVHAALQAALRRLAFGLIADRRCLLKTTAEGGKSFTIVAAVNLGGLGVMIVPPVP
jgi:hypothetical protein